ncbi:MAG TPA: DUF4232 domain-containing protein [Mycobacteriales bacterium]|nr:DUF4232 domain-containing protein [Mycobacteriales bacterium]
MRTVHATRWLCVVAGAVLVAGCGVSGGPTAAGPAAPASTTAPPAAATSTPQRPLTTPAPAPTTVSRPPVHPRPAGPGRCHPGDLSASLAWVEGAAGSRFSAVVLTNRSHHSCTVYGYGGLQLLDANHRPVLTRQVRDRTVRPSLVLLRPGMSAHADLHWSAIAHPGDSQTGPCQPEPSFLLVTPPDESRSLRVRWTGGPVCGQGRIDQRPYAAGLPPTTGSVPAAVVAVASTGGGSGEVVVDRKAVPQATGYRVIRTDSAGRQIRVVATFDITTGRTTAAAEVVNIWSAEHSYVPNRGPLIRTDRSPWFQYVDVGAGRRCYRVQAYNAAGDGPLSAVSCAAPPGG